MRNHLGGYWTLTSELRHEVIDQTTAKFLERLIDGLSIDELTELDMPMLTRLNDQGVVETRQDGVANDPSKPFWELAGYSWQTITAQTKHIRYGFTFDAECKSTALAILDLVSETIGKPPEPNPNVIIHVTFSAKSVKACEAPILLLVCDRLKVSAGPVLFPWSSSKAVDKVRGGESYVDKVDYKLTPALAHMQVSWLAAAALQVLQGLRLRYVQSIVEFNVMTHDTNIVGVV